MKKQVPNIITLLNLTSGCIATVMAFNGDFQMAFLWIVVAAVFDFFDGLAARLLGVSSKLGVELDSLADVVSFGVAPSIAIFILLRDFTVLPEQLLPIQNLIPYFAFLIPAFSAYRLAKFNIDERQTTSFLGLPTPANGLFWISYAFGMQNPIGDNNLYLYLTLILIVVFSLLMVSEIPMFSLKMKSMGFKGNERQYILAALILAFVILWGIAGIAWGIAGYILLSLTSGKKDKSFR